MKRSVQRELALHLFVGSFAFLALVPFFFVANNSFRTNMEMYRSFFGAPNAIKGMVRSAGDMLLNKGGMSASQDGTMNYYESPRESLMGYTRMAAKNYLLAWKALKFYLLNSFFVCSVTACGVALLGSLSAYVLARYRFPGGHAVFFYIIATMMFPGVLTLVPSFLLAKQLGLLNSYAGLILPYIAGGQVFATFVFKSFFDGLPEELFESARIDGAGHARLYVHIVLPLSKPVFAVVMIMSVIGTWNNFLWPFIVNTDEQYHVIASGLYVMANSAAAANYGTLFAAYVLSSVPLLILFAYATRPFVEGVTSGAFKA